MQEGKKKILTIIACLIPSQRVNYFGISCWLKKMIFSYISNTSSSYTLYLSTWSTKTSGCGPITIFLQSIKTNNKLEGKRKYCIDIGFELSLFLHKIMIESNHLYHGIKKKLVQDYATYLKTLYIIIVIISWKPKEQQ